MKRVNKWMDFWDSLLGRNPAFCYVEFRVECDNGTVFSDIYYFKKKLVSKSLRSHHINYYFQAWLRGQFSAHNLYQVNLKQFWTILP